MNAYRPFWDEREVGEMRHIHLEAERIRLRREVSRQLAGRAKCNVFGDSYQSSLVAELEVELARFLDRGSLVLPDGTFESAKADAYRWVLRAQWPRCLWPLGRRVTRVCRQAERRWPVRMRTYEAVGYLPDMVIEASRGSRYGVVAVWR